MEEYARMRLTFFPGGQEIADKHGEARDKGKTQGNPDGKAPRWTRG